MEMAEYLANAANSLARIDLLPEKIHESNFSKINARNKVEFAKLSISPSPLLSQLLKGIPTSPRTSRPLPTQSIQERDRRSGNRHDQGPIRDKLLSDPSLFKHATERGHWRNPQVGLPGQATSV